MSAGPDQQPVTMPPEQNVAIPVLQFAVLIVGAGPAGATAALLLGQLGIPCLVISRHKTTANTPRAHIVNQRAMEVLRDAGIAQKALEVATSSENMMHTTWRRSLSGREFGRLYAWGNDPSRKGDYELASPCPMTDIPQSVLEPILVEEATKAGAHFKFSSEFVKQQTLPNGKIETLILDRVSKLHYRVTSDYLLGCDGARSAVLTSIGVPVLGKQLNTAFNVHIEADLSKYFSECPSALNWILNPDAPGWSSTGNFRMVRPWNEWVVSMHPTLTDEADNADPSEAEILKRLQQMIGDDTCQIKILSYFRWSINDQVAETWQKGNVICFGDATHRHPPINGLGSNTCISDAFNVAWKIAYVLKGQASETILKTITPERKAVGDAVVRRANEGMVCHRDLWEIIGLSNQEQNQFLGLRAEASKEGQDLRQRLNDAFQKLDDEHQALGIQMNQRYLQTSLAVVELDDVAPDFSKANIIKDHFVSTYPGYHLPHAWLCRPNTTKRISTLDIVGKGSFTLLTGIGGGAWTSAAENLARLGNLPLRAHSIGYDQDYVDVYRDWDTLRGIHEDGAILVRPDHFVAWRCQNIVEQPYEKLVSIMSKLLDISLHGLVS